VHRQVPHVRERGITGAEVVDGQPHPEGDEVVENRHPFAGRFQEHGLGQLQAQPIGRDPMLFGQPRDRAREGWGELLRREVHGRRDGQPRAVPHAGLCGRRPHHLLAHRRGEPRPLDAGQERSRREEATCRVPPPHQSLHLGHPP
jgi:hypothetical protein